MAEQFSLCEGQLNVGLIATQLGLLQLAAIGAPTKNRNLQRGHSGISKVPHAVGLKGKLIRIDAVKVIETEGWQQASPGRRHLVLGGLKCRESRAKIGIVFLAGSFDFGEVGQRLGSLQVIDDGEVLIEIGEQQHR